ncbi:MAG TPA: hypothetical protein VGK30_18110 [Candidatus Binatia bacterium]|jgi:hypothetical protein
MTSTRPFGSSRAVCAAAFALIFLLARSATPVHAQVCDDGVLEPPEQCEPDFDDSACPTACADDCTCAVCGDNVTAPGVEECDGTDDTACPGLCQGPSDAFPCACAYCGDGVINQPTEECETGNDAACPGLCSSDCRCAVCGNNVADLSIETCDGTDDHLCPGKCGAPDGDRPCLCPITPYKCAYKKIGCTAKLAEYWLKCHAKAELKALGPPDPACLDKGGAKFDGGAFPDNGCFEKLERAAEGSCFTNDDTATVKSSVDTFVGSIVTTVDPTYPAPVVDPCSAGKKVCVEKLTVAVMKCLAKAEAKSIPLDPKCMLKAESKFNSTALISCMPKLATRNVGCAIDDAPTLQSAAEQFGHDITCHLDPSGPGCP